MVRPDSLTLAPPYLYARLVERPAPAIRPPVALGCTAIVAAALLSAFAIALFLIFIQSGAAGGLAVLNPPAAYPPGSMQYISEHNFYLSRLPDGSFVALSDLDSSNRANPQHRCRVARIDTTDPALPELVAQYASRMSPQAAGSTTLLREDCYGGLYDITGVRLNGDGPNLDRLAVDVNGSGKLEVNYTKRTCSQRDGANVFSSIACR